MLRAIVLVLCLTSAGVIAAYSYYSRDDAGEPVYALPTTATTPPGALKPSNPPSIAPDDRAALAREIQRELKRVGCYAGEITGVWTAGSRAAMKSFVERVNAALPVDKPDPVLLSLVQGHRERACGIGCPPGQSARAGGACVPSAVAAADKEPAPDSPPVAGSDGKIGAAVGAAAAGAAAGMALAAPGAGAKDAKPGSLDTGGTSASGPPEAKPTKRPRRTTQRPPKLVRDFMKLFGN